MRLPAGRQGLHRLLIDGTIGEISFIICVIILKGENNMKRYILTVVAIFFSIYMFGCSKKEPVSEITQEPVSMEALTTQNAQAPTTPESNVEVANTTPVTESLPPPGPYKPSVREIQTALKNAGCYTGEIDGKKGPFTKKATEEFQKANGLEVDGKVGTKTWAVLSKYTAASTTPAPKDTTLKTR